MIIKTKKYQLPTNKFVNIAFKAVLKQQWWVGLIFFAICCGYFLVPSIWWIIGAVIGLVLYLLFWLIQFYGVTQLEQGKFMFERLSYDITSQQILLKVNTKQGMPLKWNQIKRAQIEKDGFSLFISKAQIIHLPFKIFNSKNEIRFLETILERKGYIQSKPKAEK